ncbi:MAG: ACT domain-containing protein, partial [Actinomycetota bacterium]
HVEAQSTQGPWRVYRVPGSIDFTAVGIMSALTAPLAAAGLGILGVSTYDTDYILVRADAAEAAETTWREAGIEIA